MTGAGKSTFLAAISDRCEEDVTGCIKFNDAVQRTMPENVGYALLLSTVL